MVDRSCPALDLGPALKALQAPEGQFQDLTFHPALHQQLAPSERSILHFNNLWLFCGNNVSNCWNTSGLIDLLAGCTHLKGDEAVRSPHVVWRHPTSTSKSFPPLMTTMMMVLQVTIGEASKQANHPQLPSQRPPAQVPQHWSLHGHLDQPCPNLTNLAQTWPTLTST